MPKYLILILTLILSSVCFAQKNGQDLPKLTADEIVAKHLASIGTPADLAAAGPRVMAGVGTFTSKLGTTKLGGAAQFASDREKILLAMLLNSNDYPFEKMAYDGKDLTTANMPNGQLSVVGDFLKRRKTIVKQGVFAGVLNESWPLLKLEKDDKLETAGTESDGGQSLYRLKYSTSGLGDLSVMLYFDSATFRHIRTRYTWRVDQIMSPNPNRPLVIPSSDGPGLYEWCENFSNFTKVDNLILPLAYTLEYIPNSGRNLAWNINFSKVYNQPIEASAFKVS